MAINVTCSGCSATLSTPDSSAGKRAKCPKCGGAIQIPDPQPEEDALDPLASPLAQFSEEETTNGENQPDERMPCPACGEMIVRQAVKCRFCGQILDKSMAGVLRSNFDLNDPGWQKVRAGLANLYYGIITIFICIVAMVLAAVVSSAFEDQEGGTPSALFLIIFGIGGLTCLGAGLTILIGQARTTAVPASSGARGFALSAFLCMMASIALSMFGGGTDSEGIKGLGSLCSTVGNLLFILFIRRTAIHLHDEDLGRSATRFLIFGVVLFFVAIAMGILGVAVAGQGAGVILGILGLTILVAGIVAFVWYLRMLKSLMTVIDQRQ